MVDHDFVRNNFGCNRKPQRYKSYTCVYRSFIHGNVCLYNCITGVARLRSVAVRESRMGSGGYEREWI